MEENITIDNIQEQTLKACENANKGLITYLFNHSLQIYINVTENDYEIIKLIEKNTPDLLDFVLLKRVKPEGRIQKGNYYIDANTYYAILSPESQNNKKLALSMLTKGHEYLDVIAFELKTPEFLQKLAQENYQKNIFDFDFTYDKSYSKFLISYLSKGYTFSKKVKLSEDLLNDRDFILKISKYKNPISSLVSHIYMNDIEIMTQIALNEKDSFNNMSIKTRNAISKNKKVALKLIDIDPFNYEYLSKEMQIDNACIERVLSLKPGVYENFPIEIKNDIRITIKFVKNFDIDVKFLSDEVKSSQIIAKIMTEKNGNNLEYFPLFKENQDLLEIALKTSKRLSLIPKDKRNDLIIETIVLNATREENSFNLHYLSQTIKENKNFMIQIIEQDKMFQEDLFTLINDYGDHKNDYELVKLCIEKHPDLYPRFYSWKEDYELIHIYISEMKRKMNGAYSANIIPATIKAQASMQKVSIDKYVFNKTLEKRSQNWQKDNSIKIKKNKI